MLAFLVMRLLCRWANPVPTLSSDLQRWERIAARSGHIGLCIWPCSTTLSSISRQWIDALKLRPTGLGSGIDKDRPDHTVYCGGWDVGRISTRPAAVPTICAGSGHRSDEARRSRRDLGQAKAQFQMSWDAWKAWAHFIIRDDVELTRVRWCALEQQVRHARILPFDDGGAKTTGEVGSVG